MTNNFTLEQETIFQDGLKMANTRNQSKDLVLGEYFTYQGIRYRFLEYTRIGTRVEVPNGKTTIIHTRIERR